MTYAIDADTRDTNRQGCPGDPCDATNVSHPRPCRAMRAPHPSFTNTSTHDGGTNGAYPSTHRVASRSSRARVRSRVSLVAIVVVAVARIVRAWPHRERDPNRATSRVSFDRHRAYKPSGARYVSDANECVSFLCVSRSRVSGVVVVAAVVVR